MDGQGSAEIRRRGHQPLRYAENDPINYVDPTGNVPLLALALGAWALYDAVDGFLGFKAAAELLGREGFTRAAGAGVDVASVVLVVAILDPSNFADDVVEAGGKAVVKAVDGKVDDVAEGVSEGTTRLYRAVSQAELDDVAQFGFRPGPGAMETKLFATSAEDASFFGRNVLFPLDKKPLTILKVEVPDSLAARLFRFTADGKPTVALDPALLQEFNAVARIRPLNYSPLPPL